MKLTTHERNSPRDVQAGGEVLRDMGVADLPYSVATRDMHTQLLERVPRMTPEQIAEFLQRVKDHGVTQ